MEQTTIDFPSREKGYTCPCCGRFIKTYKRSFNVNMALTLILLVRYKQFDFLKVEDFIIKNGYPRCGDFSFLTMYQMLEKKKGKREDGSNRNGFYRITQKGIDFAKGLVTAPAHFLTFNNKCEGFEGEEIDIRQALGKKFDYNQLMQA